MSVACDHVVDKRVGESGQRIIRVCVEADGKVSAACLKCFEWVQLGCDLKPAVFDEDDSSKCGGA